jgi:DNA-directed RNA polymerase specialized sigma subunit
MKLYQSEKWLRKKYIVEGLTETEIAELCNVTQVTINRQLRKFGLRK